MKVSKRGIITVPKALREQYGFQAGMEMELIDSDAGLLLRRKTPPDAQKERLQRARDER